MTAKERKTQNDKGIFTVAQLSYNSGREPKVQIISSDKTRTGAEGSRDTKATHPRRGHSEFFGA
jgi:hypothetical protein